MEITRNRHRETRIDAKKKTQNQRNPDKISLESFQPTVQRKRRRRRKIIEAVLFSIPKWKTSGYGHSVGFKIKIRA